MDTRATKVYSQCAIPYVDALGLRRRRSGSYSIPVLFGAIALFLLSFVASWLTNYLVLERWGPAAVIEPTVIAAAEDAPPTGFWAAFFSRVTGIIGGVARRVMGIVVIPPSARAVLWGLAMLCLMSLVPVTRYRHTKSLLAQSQGVRFCYLRFFSVVCGTDCSV